MQFFYHHGHRLCDIRSRLDNHLIVQDVNDTGILSSYLVIKVNQRDLESIGCCSLNGTKGMSIQDKSFNPAIGDEFNE